MSKKKPKPTILHWPGLLSVDRLADESGLAVIVGLASVKIARPEVEAMIRVLSDWLAEKTPRIETRSVSDAEVADVLEAVMSTDPEMASHKETMRNAEWLLATLRGRLS